MVFAAGYMAAAIDWRQFLREAFNVAGMKYQGRFCLCLLAILLSFVVPLMMCIRIYETAQSKPPNCNLILRQK